MIRFALVVIWLAGCVQSADVECAGGGLCAAGTSCAVSNGSSLCIPNGELDDCNGHAALDECGADRRCYDADIGLVCLPAFCGNGYVDPGEACDAGDNLTGDGCSADCTSTEVCGNGVVDSIRNERCDDSDLLTNDGCSSTCDLEDPVWADRVASRFEPHSRQAMTFDIRRGRVVLFGGQERTVCTATPIVNTVHEWNGRAWRSNRPAIAPSPRLGSALAYDSDRGEAVLFGGTDSADTWLWNGIRWRALETFGPAAREGAAMAYDAKRRVMVLFGGSGGVGPLDDTWELAGTTWTKLAAAAHPPSLGAMTNPAMAYDPVRGVMVASSAGEIWELASGQWSRAAAAPEAIAHLAFDSIGRRMIGLASTPAGTVDAYAYDGSAWTSLGTTGISVRVDGKLVSDPWRGHLVFYGGNTSAQVRSELWDWDGTTWTLLSYPQPIVPYPQYQANSNVGAAMAHDPLHGRVLMFGGRTVDSTLTLAPPITWSYDGVLWEQRAASGPPGRYDAAMVADTARDEVVMFGGVVVETGLPKVTAETWIWNGTQWNPGPSGPPARRQMALGYDVKRGRIVMFGGSTRFDRDLSMCACLADTWELDGTTWSSIPASMSSPPALAGARFAYDPVRAHLVLFGGMNGTGSARTWTYDGTWHELTPFVSPSARAYGVFAWDAGRQRLVYNGGALTNGAVTASNETWELDEEANLWRRVPAAIGAFEVRADHAGATAPDGRGIVVAGGMFDNDAFQLPIARGLRWSGGDREETCTTRVDSDGDGLAACADPDCWIACTPRCPPGATSCGLATCGDQACNAPFENQATCPADCGAPPVSCGDLVCDPGETCLADCP